MAIQGLIDQSHFLLNAKYPCGQIHMLKTAMDQEDGVQGLEPNGSKPAVLSLDPLKVIKYVPLLNI